MKEGYGGSISREGTKDGCTGRTEGSMAGKEGRKEVNEGSQTNVTCIVFVKVGKGR